METDSMTQTELASYLETLARLVEATAKDPRTRPASSEKPFPSSKKIGSPQPTTAQGA